MVRKKSVRMGRKVSTVPTPPMIPLLTRPNTQGGASASHVSASPIKGEITNCSKSS